MAQQRFQLLLPSRLNKERVDALNPERGRLYGLADARQIPRRCGRTASA